MRPSIDDIRRSVQKRAGKSMPVRAPAAGFGMYKIFAVCL